MAATETAALATVTASDPMRPEPFEVRHVTKETGDTFTLTLAPVAGAPFRPFAPGQFNMLYVFGVGEVPISISGDPAKPEILVHTIRSVGATTRAMQKLQKGDWVGVRGPFGTAWPVDQAHGHDVILIAGRIGLAPPPPSTLLHQAHGRVVLLRPPRDMLFPGAARVAQPLRRRRRPRWTAPPWVAGLGGVVTRWCSVPLRPQAPWPSSAGLVMIRYAAQALSSGDVRVEHLRVHGAEPEVRGEVCSHCSSGRGS
jgi:hypothetical protein